MASLYKPEYADQAKKLCLLGATDEVLADFFEVDRNTVINWRNAHPEFAEATREGKAWADAQVVHALFRRAIGYDHEGKHYPPDPTSGIWWTKNRLGWRDKPIGEDDSNAEETVRGLRNLLREMNEADGE